jgi:WD40 repeat protein
MNMLSGLKFSVKQIHWIRKCVAFVMITALAMAYLLRSLEAQGGIYRIEMSPSGQKIAVVTSSGILIYDINLNLISEPPGRDAIAWSPDSRYLAIWGGGILDRIWDTTTNQVVNEFEEEGGSKMAWSPMGDKLAINFSSRVRIYAPFAGQLLTELETSTPIIQAIAWQPDGELLAVSTPATAEVQIWNLAAEQHLHSIPLLDYGYELAWSPDGTQLAIADNPDIVIWDTISAQITATLTGHTIQVRQLVWHDVKGLTSISPDGSIRVWDVENGIQVNQIPIDGTSIRTFAWTPDGQFLILPDASAILTKVPIGVSCDFSPSDLPN